MNTSSNVRRFTLRKALLASTAAFGLLAILALGSNAQDAKKDDKPGPRPSIEVSGYTRPGSPDDGHSEEHGLIRTLAFHQEGLKNFSVMGGTVYFAVFKNTGLIEGDTFGTGMADFDKKFAAGHSYKDTVSPGFDRKAKYLYLYQLVNDRNIDPRITKGKAAAAGGIRNLFDAAAKADDKAKIPVAEDIASFSLKLFTDPRYISSWGYFRESGFASTVVDLDGAGKKVVEKDKDQILRLSFSYLPATVLRLSHPAYLRKAKSYPLGELDSHFGVERSINTENRKSKAHQDLGAVHAKAVADKSDAKLISYADGLLKAVDTGKEPEYVQLMYLSSEERGALPAAGAIDGIDDDITRAIFRVDWQKANVLKHGTQSVLFGFTSDLPPISGAIRIDTPKSAAVSGGMRLANFFSDEGIARNTGVAGGVGVVNVADAAAAAVGTGAGLGMAATPTAAAAEVSGGGGMAGGFGGFGGTTTTGGGGGGGTPGFGGGFSRPGGGGGFGGGTGSGGGTGESASNGAQTGTQAGTQTINFNATLINTQFQDQSQSQFQSQWQKQNQNQNQNQKNHGRPGHHGHHNNPGSCNSNQGHVVPAPASLLLGLLGLPGLFFLRRRKTEEQTPEVAA